MHVLFDMNGTLFDPASAADALGGSEDDHRLVSEALELAISMAMAETLAGGYRPFSELLSIAAEQRLSVTGISESADRLVEAVSSMRPFPEAERAIAALRDAGFGTGVLTNSSGESAREMVAAAGLELDPVIGSDAVRAFKPHPDPYTFAAGELGLPAAEVILVAAHWWDVLGAKRAGLLSGWVSRSERVRPSLEPQPDFTGEDLLQVAGEIAADGPAG